MFNKKRNLVILILLVIILIGGYKFMEKKKIDTYVDKQKPRIEKYLNYHYDNIESVTITGTKKNPMGGFFINGYVNNDKNLSIYAEGSVGTDIEYVSGLNYTFYKKYNKSNNNKSVSEIEEEERNSLSFDEKMKLLKKNNVMKNS